MIYGVHNLWLVYGDCVYDICHLIYVRKLTHPFGLLSPRYLRELSILVLRKKRAESLSCGQVSYVSNDKNHERYAII